MIERGRLVPMSLNVNVAFAAMASLFLAACGSSEKEADIGRSSVPLVWQTNALESELSGFSIVDIRPPLIAVAYTDGGLQIKDPDGNQIGADAPISLSAMSRGGQTEFDGVVLNLFPGIESRTDHLKLVAMGEGLIAPVDLEVQFGAVGADTDPPRMEGFCSTPSANPFELLRLAYWTSDNSGQLVVGRLETEGDIVRFTETETIAADRYITACGIADGGVAVSGPAGITIFGDDADPVILETPNLATSLALTRSDDGLLTAISVLVDREVWVGSESGRLQQIDFEAGISVQRPDNIGEISLIESGNVGSFPDGLVAIESIRDNEPVRLIFMDLKVVIDQLQTNTSS